MTVREDTRSERNPWSRLALLLIVLSACAKDAKSASNDGARGSAALVLSSQSTTDDILRSVCARSPTHWRAVEFTDVDWGKREHQGLRYIPGPPTFAAVRSEDEWTRVWKRIADTVQTPEIRLDDSVILVLATRELGSGPVELEVVQVRLCQEDATAWVEYRLHYSAMQLDYGDRAIRAVAVPRSVLGTAAVRFVQLPDQIDDMGRPFTTTTPAS